MLIYWFLPMILFLGIVTSYEDIKFGKIRNKWIILAIFYSIIANILLFSFGYYNLDSLIKFSINGLITLAVGFIIWYANLWTAGDAKLFFAYSLLLPLDIYRYAKINFFPSFNILIYTFIPITLFLIIIVLIKTNNKEKLQYFVKAFEFKQVAILVLFLFSISWLLNLIFDFFKVNNYVLGIFLIFLLFLAIEKIFNIGIMILLFLLSIIRIIFDKELFLIQAWLTFLFLLFIFIILRFFLLNAAFNVYSKDVKIKDLSTGMIPAEIIYKEGNIYKKRKILNYGLLGILYKKSKMRKYLYRLKPEGLLKEEVKQLKKIEPKLPYKTIKIQQTLSFAPYLFMGVLLTIILKGGIFAALNFTYLLNRKQKLTKDL